MTPTRGHNNPVQTCLHPMIYRLLLACVLWTGAALMLAFGHDRYAALQIAVVLVFGAVFCAVPLTLASMGRRHQADETTQIPFRAWLASDLAISEHNIPAREAAIMVLLVPGFCAFGLTVMSTMAALTAFGLM